ncbi:WhiB family transcriptional regulator [Streptomyces rochei]|uniref:WhiB family transcriptional regulator n=1 Tax=Streptomyces rochei TaxID=1928 RepID=UPI0033AC2140
MSRRAARERPKGTRGTTCRARASCPGREQCARMALETREHYGVWGGPVRDRPQPQMTGAVRRLVPCPTGGGMAPLRHVAPVPAESGDSDAMSA